MNIIEAIKDPKLFRPFLADKDDKLTSWHGWFAALRAMYGLPLSKSNKRMIRDTTGRDPRLLPDEGFTKALFLTGRRSGKSRMASVIASYEGVLAGHEKRLSPGERGIVACLAPTRTQGRIVKEYIRANLDAPLFRNEIVSETKQGFELRNGITIEIHTGDFRSARGFTLVAAVVDEICFFGIEEEAKVKSDVELVRALSPALLTTGGKLICISSPYARRGWAYTTHKKHHGNNDGTTLVLNCPSRTLNPTLPEAEIKKAIKEDPAAARSEYLGLFRDDIAQFIPRDLVESLVVPGRHELIPTRDTRYTAFVDMSGGRADDAALAIAHTEKRKVVVDYVSRYKPPFNPYEVIGRMCQELEHYGLRRVTGDRYAAEFVASAFKTNSVSYKAAELPKSQLYLELLPRITSREIELLDQEIIVSQLSSLERRTRAGGRDSIDHPQGGHDDVANVVAGVCVTALKPRRKLGTVR